MMLTRKVLWVRRALNLGALTGIGIGAVLSQYYPDSGPELSSRAHLIVYCGLVGFAIYNCLQKAISALCRFVCDYVRLFEAHVFLKVKLIDEREFRELLNHLVRRHFGVRQDCEPRRE